MAAARLGLHVIAFVAGAFIPDYALVGLKLLPLTFQLGTTVMLRATAYALLLISCIAALKFPFGCRPTLKSLSRSLPGAMWGMAGSWFWAVGSIVQLGVRLSSRQKDLLWSLGAVAVASELPLLLAYFGLQLVVSRRARPSGAQPS